jgi:hypothetical protein
MVDTDPNYILWPEVLPSFRVVSIPKQEFHPMILAGTVPFRHKSAKNLALITFLKGRRRTGRPASLMLLSRVPSGTWEQAPSLSS